MAENEKRTYRERIIAKGLISFHVVAKETDLMVSTDTNLEKEAGDLVLSCRNQLETYIRAHPEFAASLSPYPSDPYAPPMVKEMIEVTKSLEIGPMASVAGAVAECVGNGLLRMTEQVIVENGGDIFLKAKRSVTVSIFAGGSPLSNRIGLVIPVRQMPLGVCSSSATIGHSLSMGIADVVCILSSSAIRADGAATALGNRIRSQNDLKKIEEWAHHMRNILGGVIIVGERMATWGDIELVAL